MNYDRQEDKVKTHKRKDARRWWNTDGRARVNRKRS